MARNKVMATTVMQRQDQKFLQASRIHMAIIKTEEQVMKKRENLMDQQRQSQLENGGQN